MLFRALIVSLGYLLSGMLRSSLQLFLLSPCRLRRFVRRDVCASATKIPYCVMALNLSGIWSGAHIGRHGSFIIEHVVYE